MTADRTPLKSWKYPEKNCLLGDVFPSGRPKFGPFPDVTNLMNANLCPVAIYHDLLHGLGNALIKPFGNEQRIGDLYHSFIAFLKFSIIRKEFKIEGYEFQTQVGVIRDQFFSFARQKNFPEESINEVYKVFIEPWIKRKINENYLQSLNPSDHIFFEISVGNAKIPFDLNQGLRHYPLHGRLDEIDLERKQLIERTLKGEADDDKPPLLKDYQVWLLWKILTSLKPDQLPQNWKNSDFNSFNLIVETPYKDFIIDRENKKFLFDTHAAYCWINDISISTNPRVNAEVYENQSCTFLNPEIECVHQFINCFSKNYPFPECRYDIKTQFKPWYRLLLWEKLWEGDLLQYQFFMLSRQELLKQRIISEGKICGYEKNKLTLEITDDNFSWLGGFDEFIIIRYGSIFCGKREKAKLIDINKKERRIVFELNSYDSKFLSNAILFPVINEVTPPIIQEPPSYLKRNMQKGLLKMQRVGAIKLQKAKERSVIQMMEGVFGKKQIRRGSK
jgi:hypothetical protein